MNDVKGYAVTCFNTNFVFNQYGHGLAAPLCAVMKWNKLENV